jgi:hypothetical protein
VAHRRTHSTLASWLRFAVVIACSVAAIWTLSATPGAQQSGSTSVLSTSASAINTTGYEDSPYLSPDGRSFYFMYTPWQTWPTLSGQPAILVGPARAGHHSAADNNPFEDSDIYVATRLDDGTWSVPTNMGFNDSGADCCAMTWDGTTFAYQRTQFTNSALTDLALIVRQSNGSWQRTMLPSPVNLSTSSESNPHLTASGNAIYFTSDRPGGYGSTDLYVARRNTDGSWQAPVNLGPTINTSQSEDQIWVSRDEQTLYFNRTQGKGAPQIYSSTRVNGAWSTPQAVKFGGQLLPGAEASLTDDQLTMTFALVRPDLNDILMVVSHRVPGGDWGTPVSIDIATTLSTPQGVRITATH